jgi:uncharacterized membrane protein (UPF0136 family)
MRPGYVAALIAGAVAGIAVPAALCLVLLKGSRRGMALVFAAMTVLVIVSILGITRS